MSFEVVDLCNHVSRVTVSMHMSIHMSIHVTSAIMRESSLATVSSSIIDSNSLSFQISTEPSYVLLTTLYHVAASTKHWSSVTAGRHLVLA